MSSRDLAALQIYENALYLGPLNVVRPRRRVVFLEANAVKLQSLPKTIQNLISATVADYDVFDV